MKWLSPPARKLSVVFLLLLVEAGLLQWLGGAYANGFGAHPDEAAHFVSAVMVYDFLTHLSAGQPMTFAKSFYLHYPKVAIGNWPPLLYVVLALWFLAFGVSRVSALIFTAVCAAATASLIFVAGRRLISNHAGLFAATVYLALPLVQESTDEVMTEHLVTLLILASTLLFARFVQSLKARDALLFGFAASAAILTRGSAWALLFVPPLVIAMNAQWRLLWNWRLWLCALPVATLCIPWYVATRGMSKGAMVGIDAAAPAAFLLKAGSAFPVIILQATGVILLLAALIGVWSVIVVPGRARSPYWSALLAMIVGILLIHVLVPAAIEPRYMMQLLPAVLLFAAAGIAVMQNRITVVKRASPRMKLLLWGVVGGVIMLTTFEVPRWIKNNGYEPIVANALQATANGKPAAPTVLIVADSIGEGSIIAAAAAAETHPHTMFMRGSKMLVTEDWLGRNTQERFGTDAELRTLLDKLAVNVVIIDRATEPQWVRPYHRRVEKLLESDPQHWILMGTYDVFRHGRANLKSVDLYRRLAVTNARIFTEIDQPFVEKLMQH